MAALASCAPGLEAEVLDHEQQWLAHSIEDYKIEVLHIRSIWHAQTQVVTVENGQVKEASASCTPAPWEAGHCAVEPFEPDDITVAGLFRLARAQAQRGDGRRTELRFNDEYGYPEQITVDDPDVLDDDISWRVISFAPSP